jgi:hypothetical protein
LPSRGVRSGPALEGVGSGVAREAVVALAAGELVVARGPDGGVAPLAKRRSSPMRPSRVSFALATTDGVVAPGADDEVVTAQAGDHVVAGGAVDGVVTLGAHDGGAGTRVVLAGTVVVVGPVSVAPRVSFTWYSKVSVPMNPLLGV